MSFSDHANRLDEAVLRHLADTDSAIYTPSEGDPVIFRAILDRDVMPAQGGQQSTTVERRNELSAHHDVLGDARQGERVTIDGTTWRLDRRDRDDGHFVTWTVVEVL